MKKIFIFSLFFAIPFCLFSQIQLQTTFTQSTGLIKLQSAGYKYFGMNTIGKTCKLYNTDFSLWKNIPLSMPDTCYLLDIEYVSDKLFNTDDLVELCYFYYSYVYTATSYYAVYHACIINENGVKLLDINNGTYVDVVSDADLGTKLLIIAFDYSTFPYPATTKVYSLPNQPVYVPEMQTKENLSKPFPNPANDLVTISLQLPQENENYQFIAYDSFGKEIQKFNLKNTVTSVMLETRHLSSGIYFYHIICNGKIIENQKFIVR